MKAGKSLPSSGRLQSVLYYGLAICATGGMGGFIWHQSSKLDREPDPIPVVAATQPAEEADEGPKTVVTFGEAPKLSEPATKGSSQRGEIMIRGRAGTTKGLAPATELDRTASVADSVAKPTYAAPVAGEGPRVYVAEDPGRYAREAESRRNEERRQAEKRWADSDPMWQKRVTERR